MKKRSRSRLSRGFTLMEILIVIALLGGIIAIAATPAVRFMPVTLRPQMKA